MPRIRKITIKIDGEMQELEIYYNQTYRFHIKDHPAITALIKAAEYKNRHKAEEDLVSALNTAVAKYHELKSKLTKIIRIHFSAADDLTWDDVGGGTKMGNDFPAMSLGKQYGVALEWEVLWKKEAQDTRYYEIGEDDSVGHRNYGGGTMGRKAGVYELDHDQRIIDFLESTAKQLNSLAKQMAFFFNNDDLEQHLIEARTRPLKLLQQSKT